MKDSYRGYENQLFSEEDLTGEEEEIPPLRGRARGGCMKCQQTHSLQLAVKMLYGFLALLIIAVAVLASLVFRRVDNLSEEEKFCRKQISKVQESIKDISTVNNYSNCLDVAQYQEEIARLKKEYEEIQKTVLSQEQQLDQATQSQQSLTQSSNRMTRDLQSFGIIIKRINQSLGQYLDQVTGWQVVINEMDQGMKTLVEDRYDLKATMQQVNTTVALSALWIGALQRKAEEETLVLQKITADWQNYSRVLSALKSNASITTQTMRAIQNGVSATHQRISMSSEMVHDLTLQVMNLQMQLDNVSSYIDEHEENMHDHQYHAKYYENRTGERFVTLDARMKSIEMEIDTLSSSFKATISHVQSMYQYINQESSSCQSRLNSHTEDLQNLNNTVLLLLHLADTLRMQYMMLNVRLDADVRNLSMVIEEMKLVDTSHAKLIQNVTILKGVSGPPGPKGNRGESGAKGPVGVTGPKGDWGLAGNRGPQGLKGAMGIKGDQGVQGPSGMKGGPGLKGEKGSLGPPGSRSEKGQKGDMGAPGKDGIPGPKGPAGIRGQTGLPGVHGPPGPVGVQGPVGSPGPRGIPGPPGKPAQSS
ncbi:scavenger receptor class A member 3-like isoform X1 [Sinocyclocheilus grahami]|uniref:Scavenger receptor class A member 3 n=1 Tax=Sinocyclocheilus grahami TaxID=75366 RepID=A0A672S209_SINGR|nr:PREDICTED: scavenger receptor class A member 3-like isoform X1 [Sinocyclocheilus grahami]